MKESVFHPSKQSVTNNFCYHIGFFTNLKETRVLHCVLHYKLEVQTHPQQSTHCTKIQQYKLYVKLNNSCWISKFIPSISKIDNSQFLINALMSLHNNEANISQLPKHIAISQASFQPKQIKYMDVVQDNYLFIRVSHCLRILPVQSLVSQYIHCVD